MSLKSITPCDYEGICPYGAEAYGHCEYFCGADEPQDNPELCYEGDSCDEEE